MIIRFAWDVREVPSLSICILPEASSRTSTDGFSLLEKRDSIMSEKRAEKTKKKSSVRRAINTISQVLLISPRNFL